MSGPAPAPVPSEGPLRSNRAAEGAPRRSSAVAPVPSEGPLRSNRAAKGAPRRITLRSPLTGRELTADTATTLTDGEHRWPVLDGIPFLRVGRDERRDRAVAALDDARTDDAAAELLADNDDWWDQPPPDPATLRRAYHATTLREAVDLLGLGRVGDYFLHRDHDPSGLAVTALTAAHPPAGRPVVDLACGAGHLLRRLADHGVADLVGLDVVWAKLWLARRFVLPPDADATLVCADLTARWPLPDTLGGPAWVSCHDALYFLDDPAAVLDGAAALAGPGGAVLAAHCHNSEHPAGAAGHPRRPEAWAALLPGARCYAEEELTSATCEHRLPVPAATGDLLDTEAVALVRDDAAAPGETALLDPPAGATLSVNPLYVDGVRTWPNPVWAAEYGPRAATYLPATLPPGGDEPEQVPPERVHSDHAHPDRVHADRVHRRLLVDLPEAW